MERCYNKDNKSQHAIYTPAPSRLHLNYVKLLLRHLKNILILYCICLKKSKFLDMAVSVKTVINNKPTWARAIIEKTLVGEGKVEAFLVDYGRHITAIWSDLYHLAECFANMECQVST